MNIDFNKNYYGVLKIGFNADKKEIKKAYFNLVKIHHPDKGGDPEMFRLLSESYDILMDDNSKKEYDVKSKWGSSYDELNELLNFEFSNLNKTWDENKYEDFKKKEGLNIVIYIDDNFIGEVEYERYVICKTCKGSGKDTNSKIEVKDHITGKIKYFEGCDGCDFCFEENNYVITDKGPIKISNINLGDIVLSSNNSYQKVTHLINKKYTGKILDINVCGININGVTPNHKFNIVRFKKRLDGKLDINNYNILEISAENLTTSDFILYQNNKYEPKSKVFLEKTHNRKEKEIIIDSDFIKFIACYISEGNTRGDRVVVLTFHKEKDINLINFIVDFINNKIGNKVKFIKNKKWGNKVSKIEIYNSQLAKFLKNFCGHLSKNKYIHNDILGAYDDILLETLFSCDGSYKKNCYTYTTISKKLAYQVFHLSQSLGYNANISNNSEKIDKNGLKHQKSYRVYAIKSKKMGIYTKVIKEGKCLKIRDIKEREVISTNVYNITVENTHKYTIDGLLVNNCDGTGKGQDDQPCFICKGLGKVGLTDCKTCKGEKRILGKQKLSGIKIPLNSKDLKVDCMGHFSNIPGKVGHLWLVRKKESV